MQNVTFFMLNLIRFDRRLFVRIMRDAEIRGLPSEKNGEGRMGWQRRGR